MVDPYDSRRDVIPVAEFASGVPLRAHRYFARSDEQAYDASIVNNEFGNRRDIDQRCLLLLLRFLMT
jgi:hypothetical protein